MSEQRLIDANVLLSDIERTIEESGCVNHEDEIMDCVRYAPTIDAEVVVHGEWVWEKICDLDTRPICSRCYDEPYRASDKEMPNYCPNCGADMRGDANA